MWLSGTPAPITRAQGLGGSLLTQGVQLWAVRRDEGTVSSHVLCSSPTPRLGRTPQEMPHTPSLPSLAQRLAAPPFPRPSEQPPGSAFFLLPLVSPLIPPGPEYACTHPQRGPASLFSSKAVNPQLGFPAFCSGPGRRSQLLVPGHKNGLNPRPPDPPPCSQRGLPAFSDNGCSPACLALGLFPRRLQPQSSLVQLLGTTVLVTCPFALFKIFCHLPSVNSLGLLRSECFHVITHHPSTI